MTTATTAKTEANGTGATPWSKLRAPFPESAIHQLEKGGAKLDYVGHAEVTDRLLSVDPQWNWEPMATTPLGAPLLEVDEQGNPIGLWIKLTVNGLTRIGYGSTTNKRDPIKELIGDAIRNAAMRFGVALDLWKKEERSKPAESSNGAGERVQGLGYCEACRLAGYKSRKGFAPKYFARDNEIVCNGIDAEGEPQRHPIPRPEPINDDADIPF